MLRWIGRWRGVSARQVQTEFSRRGEIPAEAASAERVVYRRLSALRQMGALDADRRFEDLPQIFWLTPAGMQAADVPGSHVTPKWPDAHHDLAVVDLAQYLQVARPADVLFSEREIRREETSGIGQDEVPHRFSAHMPELGLLKASRKFPDLGSLRGESEVWVHEVERTRKSVPRLERNMIAYVYARNVHGAVFWAYPKLYDLVRQAARTANGKCVEMGIGPKVAVWRWPPAPKGEDEDGKERSKTTG